MKVITCLEKQFGINCQSVFLKIFKLPKFFQHFQKSREWFIPKIAQLNMLLLFNHTKLTNTLYWNWYLLTTGNYKSANGQLQNSGQLQNNSVNGAMLITINHVTIYKILPGKLVYLNLNLWRKKWLVCCTYNPDKINTKNHI